MNWRIKYHIYKEDWLKETYPHFLEWLENRKNMPKEYQYQDPIPYNCACEGVDMVKKKKKRCMQIKYILVREIII